MTGSKHLILGFCARQTIRDLVPFISSVRSWGFTGDVCLIVEDMPAEAVEQLRASGIIVARSAGAAQPRMTAAASRYFCFLEYLVRRLDDYGRVMLVDPTAVVLQSDPFATPLPADIVYAAESRTIGSEPAVHEAVVQAYGEGVAANIRDCQVSHARMIAGNTPGVLRYLVAMTRELGGRTTPITGNVDLGVHNYLVHMRPLQGAWLDPGTGDRPDADALNVSKNVVLAFYQRERDQAWLPFFLDSLRCVSPATIVHCVGDFAANELSLLSQHGCTVHAMAMPERAVAENAAYLYLGHALDRIAADIELQSAHVLMIDMMSAIFPRDPFESRTVGLSVFCEGPQRVGDSPYNRDRLAFFTELNEHRLQTPVVSSVGMRGPLSLVRQFQRRLLGELVGRPELLAVQRVIQGAFNKLCHEKDLGFPLIRHPNGAEAYFDFWDSGMSADTRHGVRVGGAVPSMVFGGNIETPLLMKLRIDLGVGLL